jgi:hypothetical protein
MPPFCIVSQKFRVETDEIEGVRNSRKWPSFVTGIRNISVPGPGKVLGRHIVSIDTAFQPAKTRNILFDMLMT